MLRTIQGRSLFFWSKLVVLFWLSMTTRLLGNGVEPLTLGVPLVAQPNCTEMFVDISTACLMPCTSSDYFVRFANFGDQVASNASILVTFDSTFTVNNASLPFSNQGNNALLFNLGNVQPGATGQFSINITLDCGVPIGQSHCVEAQAFPNSSCNPPTTAWDGSDIEVEIVCQGDSVYFSITNVGSGDMSQPSQCIIIEDDVIVMVSGYYLPAGGDTTLVLPNNGGFYHFEAGLTEGNPNGFFASQSTEGCGSVTTGYLTQYPANDSLPAYEQTCTVNDTVCHFNKKIAFPVGIGPNHNLTLEIPIQYQINFQNTTPDTVNTLTILDTLSSFLNINSLVAGASSHDYLVEDLGNNVVRFTFNNINLPPNGFGFVKFEVRQAANTPPCTRIENWAEINFGQDSVLTDTVFHTINCGNPIVLDTSISLCGGGGYYLGNYYTQSGVFSNTAYFSTGTSTINTSINVFSGTEDEIIEVTLCEGESYSFGGQDYNTSGTYSIPATDGDGCPYNIILILTVIENEDEIQHKQICKGGICDFFGQPLTSSGTYSHVSNFGECYQINILVLTVLDTILVELDSMICQGDTLFWEGEQLFTDTTVAHVYAGANGCDSTRLMHLILKPTYSISIDTAICQGEFVLVGDNIYNSPGTYIDTLQTYQYCDSIITLNLSILPLSVTNLAAVICEGESYQVGGLTYSQSGTYTTVLTAANGCDSIITLELLVQVKDTTCFANAGLDAKVCGFTSQLVGTPSPGIWEVLCPVSAGEAAFVVDSDSSATVNVSGCGSYYFKYTHTHFDTLIVLDSMTMTFDTIVDSCLASDLVQIDFEDPSYKQKSVVVDMDLTYNDYTCPEDDGVTCSNVFPFEGVTPIPSWSFGASGSCHSYIVNSVVDSIIEDCLASEITYDTTDVSHTFGSPLITVNQDSFIVLDSTGQIILENDFFDYLDSLFLLGLGALGDLCPPAPEKCFPPPPCQPEILGIDTFYAVIPVHLGGRWSYLDSLGQNIPMNDTTYIGINQDSFALVVSPNATTYSPVEFSLWTVLPNDSLAAPTTATTVTLQWQELWTYDSIQIIRPNFGPLPDSCAPICPPLGGSTLAYTGIPGAPSYDCPPFTITFEGTTIALTDSIICDTYTYTVFIEIMGGTPPYTVTGLSGSFVSTNIFKSDPIPINMGYSATVRDSAGCETTIEGATCRCMNYMANSQPLVEANCVDSCVVLVGTPIGAGNDWLAQWCDETGIIATDTIVTVCETGTYYFKVTDQLTGCVDSSMTTVFVRLPVAEAGPNRTLTCAQNTVTLLGEETTGDAPIAFSWTGPGINSNNQNQQQPTVSEPGTYTLTVTNTLTGCTDTDMVSVNSDTSMPNAIISPPNILNCYVPTQVLFGNQSTPTGQLSFNWFTGNGNILSGTQIENISIDEDGLYTLIVTDQISGCTDIATVTVQEDFTAPSQVSAGPDDQLDCDHESLQLQGVAGSSTPISIHWSSTSGHIVSGDSTLAPVIDEPGIYTLLVTNTVSGCTSTDSLEIMEDIAAPAANIQPAAELNCLETMIELNGAGSAIGANIQYNWLTPDGLIVNNSDSLVTNIAEPGTYYLTVLNTSNGCEATDTVQVAQNVAYPTAIAGPNRYFSCVTDSLQLDATASDTSSSVLFNWVALSGQIANGISSKTPWVDVPGTFLLMATDTTNGCQTTDTVIVEAYKPVSFELVIAPDCLGTDVGSVKINSLKGQADDYFFRLDNGQVWYDSQIEGLAAGSYTLTVLDQDSCAVEWDFTIEEVPPLPALSFEETYHFCGENNPITLDASVAIDSQWVDYFWSNGDVTPAITTAKEGSFTVEVATVCESATYEMELIDDLRRREFFEMPNAFSPNQDQVNDRFGPVTPHELSEFEMIIFDRWGEKVFSTDSMNNLWDGTFKGQNVASDVYIFKVVASYMDCLGMPYQISKKGDVTLLR
jgi:gliding motility-associated-like protein